MRSLSRINLALSIIVNIYIIYIKKGCISGNVNFQFKRESKNKQKNKNIKKGEVLKKKFKYVIRKGQTYF